MHAPHTIPSNKGHHDSNERTMRWALSLNLDPKSADIMPGWKWDLFVKPDGFVLVVAAVQAQNGEVAVYATDEQWIIYRADLTDVPKASTLLHAQWLPRGVSWNEHLGEERITWFGRLLQSINVPVTALAQADYCQVCCQSNGGTCSSSSPKAGQCGFNCGTTGCVWCLMGCNCGCCEWSCNCNGGGLCVHFSCCGAPCHNC